MATDLATLQRWMQHCIQQPGECDEAMVSRAREVVKPTANLQSEERLDIYRGMYLLRMQEALETDYPGLAKFLGGDEFFRLVSRYVDLYPSRSYTLNRLGDHLPVFLETISDIKKPEFCRELARLEILLTQVFDEQETPALTTDQIAAVPQDDWERARLRTIAAFRLASFDYPVSQFLGAVDEENKPPQIRKRKTFVAAFRRNYRVHRLDLNRQAFELLSLLAAGKTLGEALSTVRVPQARLFQWFRDWMSEGLFRAVEIGE
jgi:hypothetical protein